MEKEYFDKKTLNKLSGYSVDKYYSNLKNNIIRRNNTFKWKCNRKKPITKSFEVYYEKIRKNIYSPNESWYLKRNDLNGNRIVDKHTLVITFAAMHKLSELSRYEPNILKRYLEKEQSWLIREFINNSLVQFVGIISSEITGDDFRQTGFRT
ncbi:hypothetical protein FDB30_11425 [Clostridium botulinum]|uniref:YaaC family protein n=1 Tax=Clostridium botulinum TaxID=1491 RepID=UPI000773F1CF|nr:YaaC family protein [Clostridium botulinum]MBN1048292.1 hypothetical protein [Clostridium botulinum]MBN1079355.1 hypothetical protein [Clostridium botulinum]NFE84760.1 hypothetical protein [Clostridium botulinum]NFG38496.1 hypothetical protein [Clostridium botulinum]NFN28263.1 hypothetical protein [Clostridium botulinum]